MKYEYIVRMVLQLWWFEFMYLV